MKSILLEIIEISTCVLAIILLIQLYRKEKKFQRIVKQHTESASDKSSLMNIQESFPSIHSISTFGNEDWKNLESSINHSQNNFAIKLRNDYPMITSNDIRIILLTRIGLSHHDIATIMNIQLSSLRIHRCRLKKKMKIKETNFSDFIKCLYIDEATKI